MRLRRIHVLGGLAVLGLVLAACAPPAAEPPPQQASPSPQPAAQKPSSSGSSSPTPRAPTTTTTTRPPNSVCTTLGAAEAEVTPTEQRPVAYVAVVEKPDGTLDTQTFEAESPSEKEAAVGEIERTEGDVVAVEPDGEVHVLEIDDPLHSATPGQWWIDTVGFEDAWGASLAQGGGVRVAIIDSGVHADHPDLGRAESGGNVVAGNDLLDAAVPGDERTDSGSHGTHVAGIAGALDNTEGGIGGAPEITIVPVRAINGSAGTISTVVDAVLWAANPTGGNADVINMSVGTVQCSDAMYSALEYAVNQGATVVVAGGNCGCTTEKSYPAAFSAVLNGVIAVAATTENDTWASFSTINSYITISAPGDGILSTVPTAGYGIKSGTSMASPMVAAAAALVKAKCPAYTPAQVRNRLVATSDDLGPGGWDPSFGAGRVRADDAVAGSC